METKDWVSLLITAVGLFVAPLLAVRLSLKQFHSQKWWELKAEAYSNIMARLSAVQRALDLWIDMDEGTRGASKEQNDLANKEFSDAKHELGKTSAAGAFLVSDDASKALTKLVNQLDVERGTGDSHQEMTDDYRAVKECLALVRECAKRDLKGA